MSDIKLVLTAAAFSALMLFAGCSNSKSESSEPNMIETVITESVNDAESVPVLTVTKAEATTTTTAPYTTKDGVVTVQTSVSATVFVVATDDYQTFEAVGFGSDVGKAHSSKPVSKGDLFVSVSDIGVMPEFELEWTGENPWTDISILDSNGNYYTYINNGEKSSAVNQATGEEYPFDIITSGSVISGFAFYGLPDAEYYTLTVNGSAKVVGSDYHCPWNNFVTYVYPQ